MHTRKLLTRMVSAPVAVLMAGAAALADTATPAAAPLPTDPVLARLISDSLEVRPELKQAESSVAADRERIPQVGALPDPVLSLGIQNDGFNGLQIGKMETSFYSIVVSQGLPWPGKRGLRKEVARLGASQTETNVSRLRLGTEADVRRAYLDLLVVRERMALLDDLDRLWQKSSGAARARYEAGDGPQSDVLRAQLELNRLQQRRAGLRAEEASRVQVLNRLRGHPLDEPISSGGAVRDLPLPLLPDLEPAVADAAARSPELAAAKLGVQQAQAQTRLAQRERWPDLSVQAGVMPRGQLEPMWTVGVSIGLPIWSGSKQGRAVAESRARAAGSGQGAEAVEQVLRLRVAERRSALGSVLETIHIYRQGLLVQSQATTESTLAQYRVGKVTFASVLDANAGFLADQEAHLLAEADAQRIAIASAEISLESVGAGSAGGLGGASVPGAGAAGGGPAGGGAAAGGAAPEASGSSSMSKM